MKFLSMVALLAVGAIALPLTDYGAAKNAVRATDENKTALGGLLPLGGKAVDDDEDPDDHKTVVVHPEVEDYKDEEKPKPEGYSEDYYKPKDEEDHDYDRHRHDHYDDGHHTDVFGIPKEAQEYAHPFIDDEKYNPADLIMDAVPDFHH
ncbi:hypothetical protein FE257_012795 [Aspergillus nanangensis]|uniref:Uncharacterized protein n=1 Tax=Aspergillus nanangensis TaxID=2582783 RepID=A0AAD4CFQ1_ASPNN|nr:hypothetical protein FE257_012795 [Aspergillus nanangensis]